MRPWLLHVLRCPSCDQTPLRLEARETVECEFRDSPLGERPCVLHQHPHCKECASRTVRTGTLHCPGCDASYPIEKFVPNFAGDLTESASQAAAEMYADLWEGYDVQRVAGEDDRQALATFHHKTGWIPEL